MGQIIWIEIDPYYLQWDPRSNLPLIYILILENYSYLGDLNRQHSKINYTQIGILFRLHNRIEPSATLFWALGIVLAHKQLTQPAGPASLKFGRGQLGSI